MSPIKISLLKLGNLKHPIDLERMKSWKSNIFEITEIKETSAIQGPSDEDGNGIAFYGDTTLDSIIPAKAGKLTVALIAAPLEGNFYLRPISESKAIISLYEMADIIRAYNYTIENYILRNLYTIVTAYVFADQKLSEKILALGHPHQRCLFDMNLEKGDIIFSLHKPILCDTCRGKMRTKALPHNFLNHLDRELPQIRRARYYQIADWIKNHPLISLFSASLFAVFLNLVASGVYELGKNLIGLK